MPTASINGHHIHFEAHGEGFPLVLAHGYCASIQMWQHQIPLLAERYRVIAYDARGHGLSSAPAGAEHYSLDTLVGDLATLLAHLGIESAYLAGHSMGGATVAALAARQPHTARATLVCNIDAGHQPPDPDAAEQAATDREQNHELVRERGLVDYARRQIETGKAAPFIRNSETERHAYLERYARQSVNGYLGVGEALPWREPWLRKAAASITGPVAIVAGTEDVMHAGAEALHDALDHSRFVSIQGAPHDSVNARPDAFNQAVIAFLDSLESGAEPRGRFII